MDAQLRELRKDEIEKIESPIIEQVDVLDNPHRHRVMPALRWTRWSPLIDGSKHGALCSDLVLPAFNVERADQSWTTPLGRRLGGDFRDGLPLYAVAGVDI